MMIVILPTPKFLYSVRVFLFPLRTKKSSPVCRLSKSLLVLPRYGTEITLSRISVPQEFISFQNFRRMSLLRNFSLP